MTTLAAPAYFELPATASYRRRRCGWFAAPGHPDGRCGTLRLVIEPAGRSADAAQVDVYAVQEVEPPLPGVREFLLLNETDASQEDVYGVVCVWGEAVKCTCKAGKCRLPCKHRDSLTKLISEGLL